MEGGGAGGGPTTHLLGVYETVAGPSHEGGHLVMGALALTPLRHGFNVEPEEPNWYQKKNQICTKK